MITLQNRPVPAALPWAFVAPAKPATDCGAAEDTRRLAGVWPCDDGQPSGQEA